MRAAGRLRNYCASTPFSESNRRESGFSENRNTSLASHQAHLSRFLKSLWPFGKRMELRLLLKVILRGKEEEEMLNEGVGGKRER